MGKWETDVFTLCGVEYTQKKDFSATMEQQELVSKLSTADFNLPRNLHKLNGKNKLDAAGLKTLRGINGSLQMVSYQFACGPVCKSVFIRQRNIQPNDRKPSESQQNNPTSTDGRQFAYPPTCATT